VFAADAALWELNRLPPVIDRIQGSCKNRAKVKKANQEATFRHDSRSVAREASAARALSSTALVGKWETARLRDGVHLDLET